MAKTAIKLQQEFCDLFGSKQNIIWDCFEQDEKEELRRKIQLVIPPPESIENGIVQTGKQKDITKYNDLLNKIIENIWEQRKYNGGLLMMTEIFILTVDYDKYENDTLEALSSTEYQIHTVFRIKKCSKENDFLNCCMIFVDQNARVYMDWNDFLETNELPKAFMIAPKNGIYQLDENKKVCLYLGKTPQCKISSTILNITDTSSLVGGIGASVVMMGGAFTTVVAAPVVVGAAVVGGVCGGYSTVRSIFSLIDRSQHSQSINPMNDSEARNHWIGISSGLVSAIASGATSLVAFMARNGDTVNKSIQVTVNIMNITALSVNGAGVINGFIGVFIKYKDDEPITTLDLIQLSTSLFLFSHSVYNFQTASNIIKSNQQQTIGGFKEDLSRNQKRMFDKMSKETVRLKGGVEGRAEIIRSMKNIPDKGSYFRDVYKINKQLNENNVRISFGSDGKAVLNNAQNVHPSEIRSQIRTAPDTVFGNVGSIPKGQIPRSQVNEHYNNINSPSSNINSTISTIISTAFIVDVDFLSNIFTQLSNHMTKDSFEIFLKFVKMFVDCNGKEIEQTLKRIIPFEDFCANIFKILRSISGEEMDFSEFIKNNLSNLDIPTTIKLFMPILNYYMNKKPKGDLNGKCKKCQGVYYTNFKE